jgi:hypothetical protein
MHNPLLTPEEAITHIDKHDEFSPELISSPKEINAAFFIDRNNNREKKRRPNFLVIKAKRNLLDFGIGNNPGKDYKALFQQLENNQSRWIISNDRIRRVTNDLLKKAFLDAIDRQLENRYV